MKAFILTIIVIFVSILLFGSNNQTIEESMEDFEKEITNPNNEYNLVQDYQVEESSVFARIGLNIGNTLDFIVDVFISEPLKKAKELIG